MIQIQDGGVELSRCPECNGEAITLSTELERMWFSCRSCGCKASRELTVVHAANAWNEEATIFNFWENQNGV